MNRRAATTATASRRLGETLSRELDAVRHLRSAILAQRAAVECADAPALRRAADLVKERSRELADLARAREMCVSALGLPAGSSIEAVVQQLRSAGEDASSIEGLGRVLRTEAAEVSRLLATVRRAAEHLAAHLSGLRTLVATPGGGVYGRRGRLAANDRAMTVDIRH